MNNLKRILSLALASVMVIGMMVVGASAAEFVDADTIDNKDAVDTLVALNIVNGMDPEHFVPEGNVTRAQMAKMIAVALHGGDEDFRGSSSGSQFTDVKDGMWYTKFINYCFGENIINGRDATHFDPEGMVTATETAVMIMRAMGYRNETFLNEKGTYSPAAVDKLAESLGLYNDTTKLSDTSVALNRQNAAQVIYNALQLNTPNYKMTYNSEGVRTWSLEDTNGKSILADKYNAKVQLAVLTGASYNATSKKFTYTFNASTIETAADRYNGSVAPTAIDASGLFMQRVRIVYRGAEVLGISAVGNNVVGEGIVGDMDESKAGKIDNLDKAVGFTKYNFNNTTDAASADGWNEYKLIDNNGDSKVDCAVIYPVSVVKITSVGSTSVTYTNNGSSRNLAKKDNTIYDGIAANDWAVLTATLTGGTKLTKLDKVQNVQATAQNAKNAKIFTVGGENYDFTTANADPTLGKSYNLVALNGYVFNTEPYTEGTETAAGLNELVYVTAVASEVTQGKDQFGKNDPSLPKTLQVKLMYANGTAEAIKTVTNVYKNVDGETAQSTQISATTDVTAGKLYTYKEAKDGTYSLTELKIENGKWNELKQETKVTASGQTNNLVNGKVGSFRFNDDAILFVTGSIARNGQPAATEFKVFTGAEVNTWAQPVDATLYTADKNGFPYAVMGVIELKKTGLTNWPGAAANSSDKYGYLTASSQLVYVPELEGSYVRLTIWNGTENVTRYNKDITASDYPAGKMVKYTEAADATIVLDTSFTAPADAVTAYGGGDDIQFEGKPGKEYSLEDAVRIYIDDEKKEGVAATSILRADDDVVGTGKVNNVYVMVDETNTPNKVVVMFIDVNNKVAHTCAQKYMEKHNAVASTDKVHGNVAYWECSCGKLYLDNNNAPDTSAAKTMADVTLPLVFALDALKKDVALPTAGQATALTIGNAQKAYTEGNVYDGTVNTGTPLYTWGIFNTDDTATGGIKDTVSTNFYLFTIEITSTNNHKMVRYNAVGEGATSTDIIRTSSMPGGNDTFVAICGDKQDATFVITDETTNDTFTFTWTAPNK